jgi:4-diphosphocytidyl-2-C-methyl-D-erythritol kinase
VPTGVVFAALARSRTGAAPARIDDDPASQCLGAGGEPSFAALMDALVASSNDLEAPAIALFPAVTESLAALRGLASCRLARMSGSGGTCFGLFATANDAKDAAAALRHDHSGWWVQNTVLGAGCASAQ